MRIHLLKNRGSRAHSVLAGPGQSPGLALLIAAPRSGAGKTTITLALLAALRRRGIAVRAAKSGPDYIDPAFHEAATGLPSFNLDSWAMPPALLDTIIAQPADMLVIETAMGLFDGVGGDPHREGTGADIAARFALPVILVLDISGQSQTAAAVARGFLHHDPAVRVAGVILNRVASERHLDGITTAMARAGIKLLGAMPRDASVALPERHLGLVQAGEQELDALLDRLGELGEKHLRIDDILACATAPRIAAATTACALRPPGQRIALACDVAFSFCYPHLVAGWLNQGAEIVPFSPLANEAPAADCDACWLPGGYPELHGGTLAGADEFMAGMRSFAGPVHGECGGYMVLGTGIEDARGQRHAMLGLLGHATSFARRKMNLGYREATLLGDCAVGTAGSVLRGHEFHYASMIESGDDDHLAVLTDARGRVLGEAGGRRGRVSGSFFHAIAEKGA